MSKIDKKDNDKIKDLGRFRENSAREYITTNQGLRINDDQNSLKAGERGPSLLEDFLLREKITHFDHERIPERIVHARGTAAHGYFQVYKSMAPLTKAKFLQDPSVKTPVFVRFSTVVGSRGSSDLARDVRGFAVKFIRKTATTIWSAITFRFFSSKTRLNFPILSMPSSLSRITKCHRQPP